MQIVRILKKCVVNEYRHAQHLSWWVARPGDEVRIGNGVNGFRREIAPYAVTLEECGYDSDQYARHLDGVYEAVAEPTEQPRV